MDRLDNLLKRLAHLDLKSQIFNIEPVIFKGAHGSTCDVYTGHHTHQQSKVAIKRLRCFDVNQEEQLAKRLVSEMYIWSRLDHKNVLSLLGFMFEDDNLPLMVSEWQDNGTLLDYMPIIPRGPKTLFMVREIASGLLYLHSKGIVHADLKSPNIFISRSGQPLLADFGISRFSMPSTATFAITVETYTTKGTLRWMAPELFPEDDNVLCIPDYKADVWAFGMIVYELLSRKLPYHEIRFDFKVIDAIQKGVRPTYRPKFTAEGLAHHHLESKMLELCYRSWIMPPKDRPDMHELMTALGSQSELIESCSLLCKNLDPSMSSESLIAHFHPFGTIISASVMRDNEGISREFGFIIFQTPDQAVVAMDEMNGKQVGCREISVYIFGHGNLEEESNLSPLVLRTRSNEMISPQPPPSYGDGAAETNNDSPNVHDRKFGSANTESVVTLTDSVVGLTIQPDKPIATERPTPARRSTKEDPIAVTPKLRQRPSLDLIIPVFDTDTVTNSEIRTVSTSSTELTPQPPIKVVDFVLPSDAEGFENKPDHAMNIPPAASAPEHPSTPVDVLERPQFNTSTSEPAQPRVVSVQPTELRRKLKPLNEREKLKTAVLKLMQKGGDGASPAAEYDSQRVERILNLLMELPKRERALCIFNPETLRNKVMEAVEVLDADEDEDAAEENEAIDYILQKMQSKAATVAPMTPIKVSNPLPDIRQDISNIIPRTTPQRKLDSPSSSKDSSPIVMKLQLPNNEVAQLAPSLMTNAPNAIGPVDVFSSVRSGLQSSQQSYSLAALARLPASKILNILRRDANVGWKLGLGKDGSGLEDRLVVAATDKFVDDVLKSTKLRSSQQKQAIGKRCFDKLKAGGPNSGLKHLQKTVVTLVDSEDLRSLAHLEASFPEVLKEKALYVQLLSAGH